MASRKSDMKGFYKQKKAGTGITKSKGKSAASKKSSPPKHAASYGSDVTQPAALISHGSLDLQDDYDGKEDVLRQFDMNMAYGPCLGMSRMDRWERAKALGLNPPQEVERLLRSGKTRGDCLWEGRV